MQRDSTRSARARRWLLGCAGLLLVVALGGGRAVAQTRDPSTLRNELERTDRVLEEAGRIVRDARDPRAGELLDLAARTQQVAWEHFRADRPRLALQATLQARELARRAIGLVQRPGDSEERARRVLDQATLALERARECAGDPPSDSAQRVLDLASARLEQARAALQEQKFVLAVEISLQVQRMLDNVCGGIGASQVQRLIENVDRLMERAAPDLGACGDRQAAVLLDHARDLLRRAHELMASRRYALAEPAARQARESLLRGLRRCEGPPDVASVDRALEATQSDVDRLGTAVRASGSAAAITILETSQDHLARARDLRQQAKLREALAELRVARNLAWRAARLAGVQGF